jgi:hypothetical protein
MPDETMTDAAVTLPVPQGQTTLGDMGKPKSTPRQRASAPRKDTRTEADRDRGPAHTLVQFRRGERLNPEFEVRVSPAERDGQIAKRHLERYFQILQAHREALQLSAAELDQVGSAILGLSFEDVNWVRRIPVLVAERYGESPLVKQLREATVADLYAVLDAWERRQLAKHAKAGK